MPDAPFNFELTKAIEDHKAGLTLLTQQQKLSVDLATVVIRSMILVNGGAIVAILTFMGNLSNRDSDATHRLVGGMREALAWFGTALFLVLLAAFLAYLSLTAGTQVISHQLLGRRETIWAKKHGWIKRAAFAVGVLSFAAFTLALYRAVLAFQ